MGYNSIIRLALLMLVTSPAKCYEVKLQHLSTVYLPHSFSGNTPQYAFDADAVEKAAFDPRGKIVYAVGDGIMHIIDASNPMNLTYLNHVTTVNKELTDVVLCGDAIFVTYVDQTNLLQGGVLQFQLYSQRSGNVTYTRDIKIGTQPDMLTATKDCTLVVALENPGVEMNGQFQDPPGGVGIIRFPQGVPNSPVVTTLDFTAFDSRFQELAQTGVRWVYRGGNTKFSDDLEPEYVTLNDDQTKAFVGFQENNAIAVVDLATRNITAIHGLGFKNWSQYKLDPSDKDNGINLASWPLYGIYQPDGIQWFRWAGQDYIITANEGDSKKYESGGVNFKEAERGNYFTAARLSASVSSELRGALQDETKLGRLHLSTIDGKDQGGKFERLYTYGGRSFSIWRASDMAQVYDSGSDMSEKTKELRRDLFNTDIKDPDTNKVADRMDKRSDDKGAEPESVAVAEVQGHLLLFVGLEKPGTIAVYGVAPGESLQPRFKSLYTDGIPRGDRTWKEMYEARELHAIDPECLEFIGADSGLADYPLLLATGGKSSTVSLLKVELTGVTSGCSTVAGSLLSLLLAAFLFAIVNCE